MSLAEAVAREKERDAELDELRAGLAVLQRMLFSRSSEKSGPEPSASGGSAGDGAGRERGSDTVDGLIA